MSRAQRRPDKAHRVLLIRRNTQLCRTVARQNQELATLRFAASHDVLTGLLNRAGLESLWPTLEPAGLLVIDLDGFKPINDQRGHLTGDLVLKAIGRRLAATNVVAARFGGDEFILVTGTDPVRYAYQTAEAIREPIRLPDGSQVRVSASIGVAPTSTPISLYQAFAQADQAMYTAKANPATPVVTFRQALPDVPPGVRRRDVSIPVQMVA